MVEITAFRLDSKSCKGIKKKKIPPTPQDLPVASTEAEQDAVFNNVLNNSGASNQPPQTPQQPQEFENMGYDQNSTTQMANLGYDQGAPTPGGPMSMGAATPYRYVQVKRKSPSEIDDRSSGILVSVEFLILVSFLKEHIVD